MEMVAISTTAASSSKTKVSLTKIYRRVGSISNKGDRRIEVVCLSRWEGIYGCAPPRDSMRIWMSPPH